MTANADLERLRILIARKFDVREKYIRFWNELSGVQRNQTKCFGTVLDQDDWAYYLGRDNTVSARLKIPTLVEADDNRKTIRAAVRLTSEQVDVLDRMAKDYKVTRSEVIRMLIDAKINEEQVE